MKFLLVTSILISTYAQAQQSTNWKEEFDAKIHKILDERLKDHKAVQATQDDLKIKFGGYVNTYYSYDWRAPDNRDRVPGVIPARDNEFNLNMAFIEAMVDEQDVRGRIALQAGTAVQSLYNDEEVNKVGQWTGKSLSETFQEAYAGYRVGEKTWVDAGVFLSHIGYDSFNLKLNSFASRLTASDYDPDYQSGVRVTHDFSKKFKSQFWLMNGWQTITERNDNKALGVQLHFIPHEKWNLIYNNYFGQDDGSENRLFNQFIFNYISSPTWTFALLGDYAYQEKGKNYWVAALMGIQKLNDKHSLNYRAEYVDDKEDMIIHFLPHPYVGGNISLGWNFDLHKNLRWRNEVREYFYKREIYASHHGTFKKNDGFYLTTWEFWF